MYDLHHIITLFHYTFNYYVEYALSREMTNNAKPESRMRGARLRCHFDLRIHDRSGDSTSNGVRAQFRACNRNFTNFASLAVMDQLLKLIYRSGTGQSLLLLALRLFVEIATTPTTR